MLPTGSNGYDLHYIEYDTNVRRETSTDHIQFDNQSIDNKVYGTFYDKDRYDEQEYPDVYQIVNPSENAVFHKKRWFPAKMINQ